MRLKEIIRTYIYIWKDMFKMLCRYTVREVNWKTQPTSCTQKHTAAVAAKKQCAACSSCTSMGNSTCCRIYTQTCESVSCSYSRQCKRKNNAACCFCYSASILCVLSTICYFFKQDLELVYRLNYASLPCSSILHEFYP